MEDPKAPKSSAGSVEVLYFAALRDLVGLGSERVTLTSATSVRTLLGTLETAHPELRGRLQAVRVAVDEAFAELDAEVRPGATVALVPPVQGG